MKRIKSRPAVARQAKQKRKTPAPANSPGPDADLNPLRAGMPALDSITGVDEFRKGKQVYRIIHTNEVDEYEKPLPKAKHKKGVERQSR